MKKILLIIALVLPFAINAQEEHSKSGEHNDFKRWRIALAMSQSYVPEIKLEEEKSTAQFIPTDGIEIQYFFSEKFSAKWINEVEFQTYSIIGKDGEHRVRENAFLTAVVLGYEVYDKLGIFAGGGYEFEKNEDLWVARVGTEYEFELPGEWDITPAFIFDVKAESHTAYTFSLTIGKKF